VRFSEWIVLVRTKANAADKIGSATVRRRAKMSVGRTITKELVSAKLEEER
jgi:hypothetical protein